ncbi:hypothetical protein A2331_01245 [Candidatus Falkowbacteria bacterium RIFOXYB2_FULL_34_18]|uniref:Uncharacterized protein n=1 Tax=Candidatus Falkowbacteria bacterium RIFOXYD2_FULL_34_120 TaxID=1798007 RepID=A0A1F5TPT2_9BACT|nr:MAG: hypothetical protein A2331_01245 [Candidatus Falkowbacteria bacterium RIFOXYB2_FULL_34_18]OGF29140.1 MAG: hypothetical protein A2500_02855 [Candidatus Falkowbacteria bacterium RIFOXYC12_FULL_34_55]OGF36236.1 MAG: hypothetical protein A2466_05025 [Candidatus Falkowbacteria bacterium RIFOXYC2_FULL_34_220]OGF38650.1 MAG: hypothetical protein A2515_06985 [Candidatus Falkowbacteria bacterium RIFOXYD12_FULL_34_57]OGF40839.1 MAG: hypothetical protein A2531_06690 [Candidatus Falkowbacteria bact
MDIKDLLADARNLTDRDFHRRLESLVIHNYKYKNLDKENRELVMGLLKKYQKYLKRGIGISDTMIRKEMYELYRNRIKLNLDEPDMKDIKEILEGFQN